MDDKKSVRLSRREREIMDIIYRLEEASAEQIRAEMPNPPGNASVRVHLRILKEKGILTYRKEKQRFVYSPVVPSQEARRSAMDRLIYTFFGGSATKAVTALLSMTSERLTPTDIDQLSKLIEQAKHEEHNEHDADK